MTRRDLIRNRHRRLERKAGRPIHLPSREHQEIQRELLGGDKAEDIAERHGMTVGKVLRVAAKYSEQLLERPERRATIRHGDERVCVQCGKKFRAYPSAPTRHCSKTCAGLSARKAGRNGQTKSARGS